MAKPEAKSKTPWATMEPRRRTALQWRQQMSQRAMQPTWRDGRVSTGLSYPMHTQEDARHSPLDANLCQPLLELSTKWGMLEQEPCWPLIMSDYYLTGNRWMTASQIFGLSTIDNKRLQTCFQAFRLLYITFQLSYLKQPFPLFIICIAFSYAGPALNYFEGRSATISNIHSGDTIEDIFMDTIGSLLSLKKISI